MASEMVEKVARALSRECWDGCEEEGVIEPCKPDLCPCRSAARAAIAAMRSDAGPRIQRWLADEREAGRCIFTLDDQWLDRMLDAALKD